MKPWEIVITVLAVVVIGALLIDAVIEAKHKINGSPLMRQYNQVLQETVKSQRETISCQKKTIRLLEAKLSRMDREVKEMNQSKFKNAMYREDEE